MPIIIYPAIEDTYLMIPKFEYGMTRLELKDYLLKEAKVTFSEGSIFEYKVRVI